MIGPDKNKLYPNENLKTVCYISNLPKRPNIEIGDYTYYSTVNESPENFYNHIEHHYEFLGDKLIIGKFCAIAEGITFIMNGANHKMDGMTTYPFNIFGNGWEKVTPEVEELPIKGDTVIGHDVWIGQNVTIMPGVTIGNGAIIATDSTVVKDVEPYSIYGGNPAKFIKKRFSEEKIEFLEDLQWWKWEEEKIFNSLEKLTSDTGLAELMNKDLDEGPFYHGTKANLKPGDLLEPGYTSNFGKGSKANFVYLTATMDAATWGAELALGEGQGKIYRVEPLGKIENDPNLTDKRFPGNPTRSYRTREPIRVVEEILDWEGHSEEELNHMKENLEKLRQAGIEAINE
jgi:virginiamycin A acetyltransferase